MASRPANPKHRRIYVSMRIKQIQGETKDLKAKLATKPKPGVKADEAGRAAHREYIFARLRFLELRKELAALKAEPIKKPEGATDIAVSDV